MDADFSLSEMKTQLRQLLDNLKKALARFSSGRAHPSLLDDVKVALYESQLPLNQVATVLAPDAKTLQITPFEPQNINLICETIASTPQLDFNPQDDGRHIYVNIPPLTQESRQLLVKNLQQQQEQFMIQLRQIRQSNLKELKTLKSEDERKNWEKQIEDQIEATKVQITDLVSGKIEMIMDVNE